jgi:hypothetical protein
LWLISSARYPNDFTERKAAEAQTDSSIFVRSYSAWATRPKHCFMPGTFKVEIGGSTKRSRVLTGEENDVSVERVIEVPLDFKTVFDKDPDGAVRDYAGISVLSTHPFLVRRDLVASMFQKAQEAGLKHAFSDFTVTLQNNSDRLLPENLPWTDYPRTVDGRTRTDARGNPLTERKLFRAEYFVHIDLAKNTDACGLAICYVAGTVKVPRGSNEEQHQEVRPVIRVALLLRVEAPPHGEILAPTLRGIIYELHKLGMEFGKITYDTWGSHESIQILQSEGYPAETLSLDADTKAYDTLKETIYDGRLLAYNVPRSISGRMSLEEELLGLQYDVKRNKIDHRPNGSKDLTDALAGAVYHCSQATLPGFAESMMPSSGYVDVTSEHIWERAANGEVITYQEFEKL